MTESALTPELVVAYKDGRISDLSRYNIIEPEAARSLAALSQELCLDGITSLTTVAARELAKHPGPGLSLDGVRSLTNSAARALAEYEGWLSLCGLTSLNDSTAQELAQFKGHHLYLDGLVSISDLAAKSLSHIQIENSDDEPFFLSLCGLKTLSDAAANALSQVNGVLALDGLESLSDAAMRALADTDIEGEAWLSNLRSLSAYAAFVIRDKSFGRLWVGDGYWYLAGLKSISDDAAALLPRFGALKLCGLESLSDAVLASLVEHRDEVWLDGLETISDYTAERLAQHQGFLSLDGLTSLTEAAAEAFARHKGGLSLDGVRTLSTSAAAELAKYGDFLTLNGLETISDAATALLARNPRISTELIRNQIERTRDQANRAEESEIVQDDRAEQQEIVFERVIADGEAAGGWFNLTDNTAADGKRSYGRRIGLISQVDGFWLVDGMQRRYESKMHNRNQIVKGLREWAAQNGLRKGSRIRVHYDKNERIDGKHVLHLIKVV